MNVFGHCYVVAKVFWIIARVLPVFTGCCQDIDVLVCSVLSALACCCLIYRVFWAIAILLLSEIPLKVFLYYLHFIISHYIYLDLKIKTRKFVYIICKLISIFHNYLASEVNSSYYKNV